MSVKGDRRLRVRAAVAAVRAGATVRPLLGLGLQMAFRLYLVFVSQGEVSDFDDPS